MFTKKKLENEMHKKEIDNLEKKLKIYNNTIPDYPLTDRRHISDKALDAMLFFALGAIFILCVWLLVEVYGISS